MPSVVQALADCLEALRQGSDVDAALERHPEHRAHLQALVQVASLIHPLAGNFAPSSATRERIWAHLLELREDPGSPAFQAGGEPSEAL